MPIFFRLLNRFSILLLLYISIPLTCLSGNFEFCDEEENTLLDDLLIVQYWNNKLNDKFPVVYDHLLQGGYFSMPSARMGPTGEMAIGYGYVHPYIHYNLKMQLVDFLEITGSYRIFKGVDDPVLTPLGFGDYSDKGANVKLSLFTPEDSHYRLPGFAIGVEDFLGTKSFNAYYIVFTQVFLKHNFEVSFGYGSERFRGFFGGMNWMPFRHSTYDYLKNLSFIVEYDCIPYHDENYEKHPKGRVKYTPWQIGIKHRLWDCVDLSLAYVRGHKFAFTASSFYNFGDCKGLLPKINDTLPYRAPINHEPTGCLRPEEIMVQDFIYAFSSQGFDTIKAWLIDEGEKKVLRLQLNNFVYREERAIRTRLNAVLSCLVPNDIDKIVIVIDSGLACVQELHYEATYLRLFHENQIGRYELDTLTPIREVRTPKGWTSRVIYEKDKERFNLEILPKFNSLFGSSRGKFKYAVGLSCNINGFLAEDVYYSVILGYFLATDIHRINSIDRLNPSQIINVRTDIVDYFKCGSVTIDEAYIQNTNNWGRGLYTRIALGYFEVAYGGVAAEWLYYPVNSPWAIGMEFAVVKKRTVDGFGFTSRIRKLNAFTPHYLKFLGTQYFLNLYYDWKERDLDFKLSAGKFLADDFGARIEVSRYFPSGLRIGFWYTRTNGHDILNSEVYYDKGIFFSIPLDIFYTKTSRSRWGNGMSAWLRDVGAFASTGVRLHDIVSRERQ